MLKRFTQLECSLLDCRFVPSLALQWWRGNFRQTLCDLLVKCLFIYSYLAHISPMVIFHGDGKDTVYDYLNQVVIFSFQRKAEEFWSQMHSKSSFPEALLISMVKIYVVHVWIFLSEKARWKMHLDHHLFSTDKHSSMQWWQFQAISSDIFIPC